MIPKASLSILIPTVEDRKEQFNQLLDKIRKQAFRLFMKDLVIYGRSVEPTVIYFEPNSGLKGIRIGGDIEIIWYLDNKEKTVGEKRQILYQQASGMYSVQWDDDDDIAEDGLEKIIGAMVGDPDCITYKELVNIDGVIKSSNFSLTYADWEGDGNMIFPDGFSYHRTPFFKTPIKTDIAKSVPVPFCRFGEDHQYAQAIKPLLKTECHIPAYIYHYNHISTNFNERYGIK